ncbi:MAG: enoyl-CoA hydratase [Gordonia amarae]
MSNTTDSGSKAMSTAGSVDLEIADGVGWITINNPARRNALSVAMMETLHERLRDLDADGQVCAVVIRGAGDRAFASGVDISEFEGQQESAAAQERFDTATASVFGILRELRITSIAMIHGYCLGGGLAVALGTDIRIAAEGASFAIPAARLGLGYPMTNTEALVSLVGPAMAAEILYTARRLDSSEAERIGLVNRIVPTAELDGAVRELTAAISANAPLTIAAAKASIRSIMRPEDEQRAADARAAIARCGASEDFREGQRAFMEKRSPRFTGR